MPQDRRLRCEAQTPLSLRPLVPDSGCSAACIEQVPVYKRWMRNLARTVRKRDVCRQQSSLLGLIWLILAQFPVPCVHSHDDLANDNPVAYERHLRLFHHDGLNQLAGWQGASAASCEHDQDFHWHYVLPWELGMHESDGLVRPTSASIFGMWLSQNAATMASSSALLFACEPGRQPCHELFAVLACRESRRLLMSNSFAQSYVGVSLQELVCVCLI